ncbi:MAG: hypothetical protein IPH66_06710 [Crocinitomicaceae bacterium]|nr:hypothetical protein [Crocinitomicaceae bacterium]
MKNFVLVAGVDYVPIFLKKTPTDFLHYCNKQLEKLYSKEKSNEDLNFYVVDIRRGKIHLISYLFNSATSTHSKNTTIFKTFDPVVFSNYFDVNGDGKKIRFHPNQKNIISKRTIYELIEMIGTSNPETLKELSVFSHAYLDGPILLNSAQESSNYTDFLGNEIDVVSLGYDPNDYDMRMWDFTTFYNLTAWPDNADRIVAFKAAFHPEGIVKIWGCNFWKLTNKLLAKIRSNVAYKRAGLTNDVIFNFSSLSFTDDMLKNIINPVLKTSYVKEDKITLKFLDIRRVFCRLYTFTYPHVFSKFIERKIQAALPATYADISPTFRISSLTFENVIFYQNYFEIETDDERLNYGIYKPDFDCKKFLEEIFKLGDKIQTPFGEIEIIEYSEYPDPDTGRYGVVIDLSFTPFDKTVELTQQNSPYRWIQTVTNNYDVDAGYNELTPAGTQVEFVDIVDRDAIISHIRYENGAMKIDDVPGRKAHPDFTVNWQAQTSLIKINNIGDPDILITFTWGFTIEPSGISKGTGLKRLVTPSPFHLRAINENLPIDTYD